MLVRYTNPWAEMANLRRQFDRMFEDLAAPIATNTDWIPAIELKDEGDNLVLKAQLPGIDAKDLDIQVTREAVALSGEYRSEQQAEEKGFVRSEFRYGSFRRVVPLPVAVQNEQVQADYTNGILSLTLPKVVEARNKVVKVNLPGVTQDAIADTTAVNPTPDTGATAS